jgi:hypothetical protein
MNEENVNYLQTQLKFLGFGDKLNERMVELIRAGKPEFTLKENYEYKRPPTATNETNPKDTVSYELYFKKGGEKEMYFFNKYEAALVKELPVQKEGALNRVEIAELKNTFYIDKGKGVTAKEAYNLLDGRAVYKELTNKEGENYNAWIKLNLDNKDDKGNYKTSMYTDKYGFDLVKALDKIQSMEQPYIEKKEDILQSLKKGNVTPISIDKKDEGVVKFSLQANPQFHSIDVFDSTGKKQFIDRRPEQELSSKSENKVEEVKKEKVAETQKEKVAEEQKERPKQRMKR